MTPQWFSDLPLILTAGQGLTGFDMRSTHCEGQIASLLNATLLKAVGRSEVDSLFAVYTCLSKVGPLPRLRKAKPWPTRHKIKSSRGNMTRATKSSVSLPALVLIALAQHDVQRLSCFTVRHTDESCSRKRPRKGQCGRLAGRRERRAWPTPRGSRWTWLARAWPAQRRSRWPWLVWRRWRPWCASRRKGRWGWSCSSEQGGAKG